MQELGGALVPLLLVQEIAVRLLFVRLTAGDDVEKQPALGVALERTRHLRGQRRTHEPGPERHQEFQRSGGVDEHRRCQPRVLTPRAGRGQTPSKPLVSAAKAIWLR